MEFILKGEFMDISPGWYQKIGTTIIITIVINTVSTPVKYYAFEFITTTLKRFVDRGFKCKEG